MADTVTGYPRRLGLSHLVKIVAAETGRQDLQVNVVIDGLIEEIMRGIVAGRPVRLAKFGKFWIQRRSTHRLQNFRFKNPNAELVEPRKLRNKKEVRFLIANKSQRGKRPTMWQALGPHLPEEAPGEEKEPQ